MDYHPYVHQAHLRTVRLHIRISLRRQWEEVRLRLLQELIGLLHPHSGIRPMVGIEVVGVDEEEEGGIGEGMEMEASGGEEEAVVMVIGMIDRGTLDGEEGVEGEAPNRLSGLRVAFFVFLGRIQFQKASDSHYCYIYRLSLVRLHCTRSFGS